jgi:hypothetical protein
MRGTPTPVIEHLQLFSPESLRYALENWRRPLGAVPGTQYWTIGPMSPAEQFAGGYLLRTTFDAGLARIAGVLRIGVGEPTPGVLGRCALGGNEAVVGALVSRTPEAAVLANRNNPFQTYVICPLEAFAEVTSSTKR